MSISWLIHSALVIKLEVCSLGVDLHQSSLQKRCNMTWLQKVEIHYEFKTGPKTTILKYDPKFSRPPFWNVYPSFCCCKMSVLLSKFGLVSIT